MSISEEQFGFMKGKYTNGDILCDDSCKKDAETYDNTCTLYSLMWEKHTGRTVLVYARQGDTREVGLHQIGEEHVLSVRNCSELSCRNKRRQWKSASTNDLLSSVPVSTIINSLMKKTRRKDLVTLVYDVVL